VPAGADAGSAGASTQEAGRPAPWSLDTLNGNVGYMLRRAQLAVFAEFREALGELDLRPGQYAVLIVIDRNAGLTQSQVGNALGIHRANFVAVIRDLERRGLARRMASARDRRSKGLTLTAAGRRVLERAEHLQRLHERRIDRQLGPGGRERLLRLLARIVDAD